MEAFLLGDDDDDSDDDNNNNNNNNNNSTEVAVVPAPAGDLSARLKSLYSPANNSAPKAAPVPVQHQQPLQRMTSQPQQAPPPPVMQQRHTSQPMPQQQRHHSQQPQQQQSHMSSSRSIVPAPGGTLHSSSSSSRGMPPPAQQQQQVMSRQPQQQQAPPPQQQPSSRRVPDPFEPTPLTSLTSRTSSTSGQPQQHRPVPTSSTQQQPRQPTSRNPLLEQQQREAAKKAKEQFLLFTRVLMKYLENKDPAMHARAKNVIRECADKNKKKEPGYESVTASMKTRLRQTVGDVYWKKAEGYLLHFQKRRKDGMVAQQQQQQQKQQQHVGSHDASSSSRDAAALLAKQKEAQQKQQADQKKEHERRLVRERLEEMERRKKNELAKKQQQQEEARKKTEKARAQQQAQAKLQQIRDSNAAQMAALKAQQQATNKQRAGGAAFVPKQRKNSSGGSVNSATSASRQKVAESEAAPPREYNELMEQLEHAVDYDWTTAGLLLGNNNKADLDLNAEQRALLYGKTPPPPAASAQNTTIRRGWHHRNIVTARAAWAKVRLVEWHRDVKESKSATPVVAGVALPAHKPRKIQTSWLNEDRAEQDSTLACLSEATNMYVTQILEKALECARQRENVEGVRLWHSISISAGAGGSTAPPIGLRLGCDVTRQVAVAAGNAARTVQRMEEALVRKDGNHESITDKSTFAQDATCMEDLACRPKLAAAVEQADYTAKRHFEISGGKDAAAPFGRVSKKAKIMAHDFLLGMELHQNRSCTTTPVALHFV